MIAPISSSTHAADSPQSKPVAQQPQAKPQPASTDTVTISVAKQIVQESLENSVQTSKEAASGDLQAKRLLGREAAQHAAEK